VTDLIFRLPPEACSPNLTKKQEPVFGIVTSLMSKTGRKEIPMPVTEVVQILERAVKFMRSMGLQGQGRMLIVAAHIRDHNPEVVLDLNSLMVGQSLAHRDEHLEIVAAALTEEFVRDGRPLNLDKLMERLVNGFPTEEHLDSVLEKYADCPDLMWTRGSAQ
jgi:hypothetical protein